MVKSRATDEIPWWLSIKNLLANAGDVGSIPGSERYPGERNGTMSMGFPDKNTGESCHFLLQGIFLTQGSNPHLLHWQADSLPLSHLGSPLDAFVCSQIVLRVIYFSIDQSDPAVKQFSQVLPIGS